MTKTSIAVALSAGIFAWTAAHAGVISQDCTGCSISQIETLAVNCNQGYTYVHNFSSNRFYKVCFIFNVNDESHPPKLEKDYLWYTPESQYQQAFQAYENVYANNGYSESININVQIQATDIISGYAGEMHTLLSPATDNNYVNAYDTIVSASDNDRVINALMTNYFNSAELKSLNPSWGSALVAAVAQA